MVADLLSLDFSFVLLGALGVLAVNKRKKFLLKQKRRRTEHSIRLAAQLCSLEFIWLQLHSTAPSIEIYNALPHFYVMRHSVLLYRWLKWL